MQIIKTNFSFCSPLTKRTKTEYIVLHHRGGCGDAASIHAAHLANGWAGIGYHLYIRKDGSVFEGRPLYTVGAHAVGFNQTSVGVCFEGNFENEKMSALQLKKGSEVILYLMKQFPAAKVVRHRDLCATACPGRNFPFDSIKKGAEQTNGAGGAKKLESANDITWELKQKIEIQDTDGFVAALDRAKKENSPLYWGYYKLVNK